VLDVPIIAMARADDLLFSHLERMPKLPSGSRIVRLSADRDAWGAALREVFLSVVTQIPAPAVKPTSPRAGLSTRLFQHTNAGASFVRAMTGGAGRPLVLLHHCPGGSSDFADAMRRLGRERPVYALDLPGNGRSDGLGAHAALADYASAVSHALAGLGVSDADLAGDGIGGAVALAMAHTNPARYPNATVANLPISGSVLPSSFAPESFGEHLIRAWHTVRDDVIHGPWCSRAPHQVHAFGSELDVEGIHRRAVDALLSEDHLDLCRAALAAPLGRIMGNATVLSGTTPLASRIAQ
jgi:pimeloyl-ACP methyl ester carboxylesterase